MVHLARRECGFEEAHARATTSSLRQETGGVTGIRHRLCQAGLLDRRLDLPPPYPTQELAPWALSLHFVRMKSLSTTAPRTHGVGTPQVALGGACPVEILPSSVDNHEKVWPWTIFPDLQKSPGNRNGSTPYAQDHLRGLSALKDGIPGSFAEIAGNCRLNSEPDPGPRSGVELRPISRRTSHAPPMRLKLVGETSNLAGGAGALYEPGHNFGAISDA